MKLLVTSAQKAAKARWDLKTKQFAFRLRIVQDADVIERLEQVPERTEYIRHLVRKDIHESKH